VASANANQEISNTIRQTDSSHNLLLKKQNRQKDDIMFTYNKNISNNSYKCLENFKNYGKL
jgi:hypothetical protein